MVAITTLAESTLRWKEPWCGHSQFNRERPMDSFAEQLSNPISELCGRIFPTRRCPNLWRAGFPSSRLIEVAAIGKHYGVYGRGIVANVFVLMIPVSKSASADLLRA